jgi:hypothetical protein
MSKLKVLINDQQLAESLAKLMLLRYLARQPMPWTHTDEYVNQVLQQREHSGFRNLDFVLLHSHIQKDINDFQDQIKRRYKRSFRPLVNALAPRISGLALDEALKSLVVSEVRSGLVDGLARCLTNGAWPITVREYQSDLDDLIIRNTINNEQVLQDRLQQSRRFWYIDSGYTNHIAGRKLWHRIVRDSMHQIPDLTQDWPVDRLGFLASFPRPWNDGGSKILIVESSVGHYHLHGDTKENWQGRIIRELDAQGIKMKRMFYPKENKKTRKSVYQYLSKDPSAWYCVISDSSAAAIEAIWLGIPVITLRPHITTPVSRNSVSDIRNLYRGPLSQWLCALTYSQFTKKEIQNGTALEILRKYHGA